MPDNTKSYTDRPCVYLSTGLSVSRLIRLGVQHLILSVKRARVNGLLLNKYYLSLFINFESITVKQLDAKESYMNYMTKPSRTYFVSTNRWNKQPKNEIMMWKIAWILNHAANGNK